MYELKVDREIQGASVLVRWCLDPETTELLREHATAKPSLLLVVPEYPETRVLAPLENVMQYIPVRKPGSQTILSAIVWRAPESDKDPRDTYLRRVHGDYSTDLVIHGRRGQGPRITAALDIDDHRLRGIVGPSLQIDVPKEVFAKEPPKWEQKWVNWWFKEDPVDQCAYRRRRMLAYTIKPIAGLAWLMLEFLYLLFVGVLGLGFLAAGFYKLDFVGSARYNLADLWEEGEIRREKNYWYQLRQKFSGAVSTEKASERRMAQERKAQQRRQLQEEQARKQLLALYQRLACAAESSSQSTPPMKARLYLVAQDLKAKVCKPFAG